MIFIVVVSGTWCFEACKTAGVAIQSLEFFAADSVQFVHVVDYATSDETFFSDLRTKEIVVQFHLVDLEDGRYNYSSEQGGQVVMDLLHAANSRWASNDRMNLPMGNLVPVCDTRLRMVPVNRIDSSRQPVVQHFEKDGFYRKKGPKSNRFSEAMIDRLVGDEDSILHVFLLPFDPGDMEAGRQKVETTGIAMGNRIKLAGLYESGLDGWQYAGLLNHEIGHVLSLRHTWNGRDGCPDTPENKNCWMGTTTDPCSNNLMDYNAHQSAVTPCQISKMHTVLSRPGSRQRRLLVKDWCRRKITRDRLVLENEKWTWPRDLSGNLTIKKGGSLHIGTAVSFPPGASVIIEEGGTLILTSATLYQACGLPWKGIILHKKGKILADRHSELRDCDQDLSSE